LYFYIQNSISTNASLLYESKVFNEELVNELVQASSCLSEILNNTLDISKLDEGKVELNKNYESIRGVTDIAINICRPVADKRGVSLNPEYNEKLPEMLEFDKGRVTQIMMNLIGNALKFTPKNGKVTVKIYWDNPNITKPLESSKSVLAKKEELNKEENIIKKRDSDKDNIPDENSPVAKGKAEFMDFSDMKIPGKIKNHLFVSKMHSRNASTSRRLHTEDAQRHTSDELVRMSTPSPINPEQQDNTPLTFQNDQSLNHQKTLKRLSTFCVLPDQNPILTIKPAPTPKSAMSRPISLLNLSKDFRMTQKSFPKVVNNSKPLTPQKNRDAAKSSGSESPKSSISNSEIKQGTLYIEISDTGCGMTNEEKEKLFQPFSQTSKKIYEKYGGTGLGLWLCHKLLQAMGGKISCESTVGKGTTFKVAIPAKSKVGAEYSPTSQQAYNGFKGFTVLCYLRNGDQATNVLKRPGCNVISFDKFEHLIEALKENRNKHIKRQVVITGLKGAKLIREFTKQEPLGLKESQIIVITSIFYN